MVGTYYGQIDFTMGWSYGLKAFTAAILGGIGNIPGAMIGGLLLGVIEALGASYLAMAWKDAIAFLVLILILIIRPTGLLGERGGRQVMSLFKRYYPVLVAVLVAVLPLGMNTYWTEVAVNVGLYAAGALLNVILGQAGIFHMGQRRSSRGRVCDRDPEYALPDPHPAAHPRGGRGGALFALIVARPIIHLRGDYLPHRDHRHRGNRPHRPDQRRVRPDRRRERHFRHRPS